EAKALLEWLASEEAQSDFAGLNQEYPVNTAVDASPEVRAWGSFRSDTINVETMGHLQADAVRLMDRAGYY
ncbi:MAG: iron ABC transporter substrate-binding protein, partial [Pseudomonadales bacterium]|nr:iron ABC transporter substrate-binding protein [Pseudomonadales bacterium]